MYAVFFMIMVFGGSFCCHRDFGYRSFLLGVHIPGFGNTAGIFSFVFISSSASLLYRACPFLTFPSSVSYLSLCIEEKISRWSSSPVFIYWVFLLISQSLDIVIILCMARSSGLLVGEKSYTSSYSNALLPFNIIIMT